MTSAPSLDVSEITTTGTACRPRLDSVDLLRGTVMVLMVLDHTRDYFSDVTLDPTNLAVASPGLFLTRWITHFCAPVFAFLAGTGAFLATARHPGRVALARFLVVRGFWLILLEQTIEPFGMIFRPSPGLFLALVLWSIGWSLVVLGVLVAVGIPSRLIGIVGLILIASHNLVPPSPPPAPWWLTILHQPGAVGPIGGAILFVGYPLIPWVGVVMAGFGLGEILGWEPRRRRRFLIASALGATALFVALRWGNVYGDPRPWQPQRDGLSTLLSFVNTQKYPPSLLFLLMTLGPALGLLAVFDRVGANGPVRRALATLGRVPLFYYLLQWYVIHVLAIVVAAGRGQPLGWLFPPTPPVLVPPESRFGLAVVYVMSALVVLILYAAARWFADFKRRRRDLWWLAYL